MSNDDADAISAQIIKQKGWHVAPTAKQTFLEQRLMAGFVWKRARDLLPSIGAANLPSIIDKQLTAVQSVLNTLLGADRKSGTLLGPRASGSSDTVEHLDLDDLAHQRVAMDDKASRVTQRKAAAILARRAAVETIAWRAVTLETATMWTDSMTLNVAALNEMIDRRLRTVERMRYNVGDVGTMVANNETDYNFPDPAAPQIPTTALPGSNWLDGLRVRLFEYMEFPGRLRLIPNIDPSAWPIPIGASSAQYAVFPSVSRTLPDGTPMSGSPANAWHFLADIAANWQVSLADGSFYRIDLGPAPLDPVSVIDKMFDYRSTLQDGTPQKADIWNRSWLLCDQVMSALHLEALLFGLRRRNGSATGEKAFRDAVSQRPSVTTTFESDPNPHTFDTPFVSLGGFIRNPDENEKTTATVLMQSDVPAGQPFADPYFRNERIAINDLQVGDQVKFLNAPVYKYLTRNNGVWKLENALILELQPTADDPSNRTNVSLSSLIVQGHGTVPETYDGIRSTLGDELDKLLFHRLYRKILNAINNGDGIVLLDQPSNTLPGQIVPDTLRVFPWAPFPENDTVIFQVPAAVSGGVVINSATVKSPPWWLAIPRGAFGGDLTLALASVPHSIGANDVGANAQPVPALPQFKLFNNQKPLDKYILFPLFEPALAPGATDRKRGPWGNYLATRGNTPMRVDLRSLDIGGDVSFVPGLYYRDTSTGGLKVFGTVRPNPSVQGAP
jgi:hypothetical protein